MAEEEFDFRRLRERNSKGLTELERTERLKRDRLAAKAQRLARAIWLDFARPITAGADGASVTIRNGRGGILTIKVLKMRTIQFWILIWSC